MSENSYKPNINEKTTEGYSPVTIDTERGKIDCHHYHVNHERRSMIYVGGVGGDFDTPAKGLYPKLCENLLSHGISGLRIKYRHPTDLEESVFDAMAGIAFLQSVGVEKIGLIGHSLGGAVVIQAGVRSDLVKVVITLSTQSYGTDEVAQFQGKSLLLIHGILDDVLPPFSSQLVYQAAPEPKKMVLLDKSRHVLDEQSEEVYSLVYDWITQNLV